MLRTAINRAFYRPISPCCKCRDNAFPSSAFLASSILCLVCISGIACRQKTPSQDEFAVTIDQAFQTDQGQPSLELVGTLESWNQSDRGAPIAWAIRSPDKLQPRGKIRSRSALSLDSMTNLLEATTPTAAPIPPPTGDQCEFAEWENQHAVWRMRTATIDGGYLLTLEKIAHP